MNYLSFTYLIVPTFLVAMLALMASGHRVGTHRIEEDTESVRMGLVSVETAVFGVLGLILAFTYSGASTRFELRRTVAVRKRTPWEPRGCGWTLLRSPPGGPEGEDTSLRACSCRRPPRCA
jgi:hypothetical protein